MPRCVMPTRMRASSAGCPASCRHSPRRRQPPRGRRGRRLARSTVTRARCRRRRTCRARRATVPSPRRRPGTPPSRGGEVVPHAGDQALQRRAAGRLGRAGMLDPFGEERRHETFRITPTTRPRTRTSVSGSAPSPRSRAAGGRGRPPEEALDRRLLADQRDDDLAVLARCPAGARRRSRPRGSRRPSSSRRARAGGTRRPRRRPAPGTSTYSSMFSSASIGWPAATWPTSGRPFGRTTFLTPSTALSSSSIARGLDGSRRSSPIFSRFARWACTVEEEARPTALPMSRTVGG